MCFQLSLEFDAGLASKNQRVVRKWEDWQNSRRIYLANAFTKPLLPVFTIEDPLVPREMRWGLVPPWAKDPDEFLKKASTYNAISVSPEGGSFYDKPSFRNAANKEQRCLIPATGFFEFHHLGKVTFPHYIHLKSRELFYFAGIYEPSAALGPGGGTFSILTTEANPLMAYVHNNKKRMPVILPQELEQTWLTAGLSKDDVLAMCVPYPADDMEAWTVSRLITSRTEDPDQEAVRHRVDYPELGLSGMFA